MTDLKKKIKNKNKLKHPLQPLVQANTRPGHKRKTERRDKFNL